jgi:hypothetical protein
MYDTIYSTASTAESDADANTTTPATATVLTRYVWHWIALGLMVLAG